MPFLRQWFVPNERRFSWIDKENTSIYGLISAKERATSASWEIDYFLLASGEEADLKRITESSRGLLDNITFHAARKGVRKIFFRSYSSSPSLEMVHSSDFRIYLKEYLFSIESAKLKLEKSNYLSGLLKDSGYTIRPRQPGDDEVLYNLIYRMQPTSVKNVESVNLKDWQETREKGCLMEHDIVIQKGHSPHGWFCIKRGMSLGHFRVMAYTPGNGSLEAMFLFAANYLKNHKTIYCTLRDYQNEIRSLLREKEFVQTDEFTLAFKEISITEKKRVLLSQQA